ncbi:Protein lifeguard 1 [Symbiodinium microadriaticum]|uniref:Protein lifeguard 1 n=1 Tax=Symbiodinium microadriaticum TaxID=2951 RepID=A0A1Q9D3Y3_SYMMI|nr:Protein lifeguard 1 [Symbiodinium microadriaticum]
MFTVFRNAAHANRERELLEAGFLQRLAGAERQRDALQAQINYSVYDVSRDKDLLEARLRGELDDAKHQREVQEAKMFAVMQDSDRQREIDQAKLSALLHDERRQHDVRQARLTETFRRQELKAHQHHEELGDQLRHQRSELEEERRRAGVLQSQLESAQAELVKAHGCAFDLKAALENLKTLKELRDAEEKRRKETEESRQALLHHVKEALPLPCLTMEMNEQTPLSGEGEELAGIHDTVVRHGFVRKVYGILSMQLIVTFARLASHRPWAWLTVSQAAAVVTSGPRGFSCVYQRLRAPESVTCKSSQPRTTAIAAGRLLCNFNLSMQSTAFDGAHLIVRSRSLDRSCWLRTMRYALQLRQTNPAVIPIVMTFSIAVTIATMLVFLCCPQTMRKSPTNYVLLSLFTVAESFMVGFICVQYTAQSVLVTFAVTSVVVVALSIFACQTKYDITGFMPYFLMATLVLFGFGFALSIAAMCGASQTGAFQTLNLVYAAGGALLFSGYIIMDTQLIVGGKHQRFRFCIDDYCMAAITIYLDIVQLFLFLLRLLGERRR